MLVRIAELKTGKPWDKIRAATVPEDNLKGLIS
jgi:hypothetical protein